MECFQRGKSGLLDSHNLGQNILNRKGQRVTFIKGETTKTEKGTSITFLRLVMPPGSGTVSFAPSH